MDPLDFIDYRPEKTAISKFNSSKYCIQKIKNVAILERSMHHLECLCDELSPVQKVKAMDDNAQHFASMREIKHGTT